jgi:S-adenosylmethionine hydrolase
MVKRKSRPSNIVTFISDFGYSDTYISQVKGVMLGINPSLRIIDITHNVQPGDVQSASFLLWSAYKYFPEGTVHLAVVDPGVGTERSGVIVETEKYFFVAPDNGLLTMPLREEKIKRIIKINNKSSDRISNTFHGRDLFAPVSAQLAKGVPSGKFGDEIALDALRFLSIPEPEIKGDKISGRIIHIDNFGNLITNIPASQLRTKQIIVKIKGRRIRGLSKAYGYAPEGHLLALINSAGLLEISVNSGSAEKFLKCRRGERVIIDVYNF